jgi:hypothetical protein
MLPHSPLSLLHPTTDTRPLTRPAVLVSRAVSPAPHRPPLFGDNGAARAQRTGAIAGHVSSPRSAD